MKNQKIESRKDLKSRSFYLKHVLIYAILFFIPLNAFTQNLDAYLSANAGFSNILGYNFNTADKNPPGFSYAINFSFEKPLKSKDFIGLDLGWLELKDKTTVRDAVIFDPRNEWIPDTLAIADVTRVTSLNFITLSIYGKHSFKKINFRHGFQLMYKVKFDQYHHYVGRDLNGESYNEKEPFRFNEERFKNLHIGYQMGLEYPIAPRVYLTLNAFFNINEMIKYTERSRAFYVMLGGKYALNQMTRDEASFQN